MERLRFVLLETGEVVGNLPLWTSHCFRRGSAADVLRAQGVKAMIDHGEWSSSRAAEPYASRDEQDASTIALASWLIDVSDEDT